MHKRNTAQERSQPCECTHKEQTCNLQHSSRRLPAPIAIFVRSLRPSAPTVAQWRLWHRMCRKLLRCAAEAAPRSAMGRPFGSIAKKENTTPNWAHLRRTPQDIYQCHSGTLVLIILTPFYCFVSICCDLFWPLLFSHLIFSSLPFFEDMVC